MIKKLTDEQIKTLARFGADVSRHCRLAMTGEQWRTIVPFDRFYGRGGRSEASALEYLGLIALEDIADLRQYRIVKPGQHQWTEARWEKEIRNRL